MLCFLSFYDDLGTPPTWRPHSWEKKSHLLTAEASCLQDGPHLPGPHGLFFASRRCVCRSAQVLVRVKKELYRLHTNRKKRQTANNQTEPSNKTNPPRRQREDLSCNSHGHVGMVKSGETGGNSARRPVDLVL